MWRMIGCVVFGVTVACGGADVAPTDGTGPACWGGPGVACPAGSESDCAWLPGPPSPRSGCVAGCFPIANWEACHE